MNYMKLCAWSVFTCRLDSSPLRSDHEGETGAQSSCLRGHKYTCHHLQTFGRNQKRPQSNLDISVVFLPRQIPGATGESSLVLLEGLRVVE